MAQTAQQDCACDCRGRRGAGAAMGACGPVGGVMAAAAMGQPDHHRGRRRCGLGASSRDLVALVAAACQALGGAVVLIGAVVVYLQFTQQQQPAYQPILPQQRAEGSRKAANDLLISNQVSKGFEQLAGKETAMRLGGIYALEGVLNTSEQYHQPVLEVLCAFVRDSTTHQQVTLTTFLAALFPAGRDKTAGKGDGTPPAADVQAALTVIGRRKPTPGRVDLSGVNIPRADLSEAQLADAYLMDADLEGADLSGSHLKGAFLNGAHLEGAHLNRAHLEGATLYEAHLEGAILAGADLEGSDLSLAHLKGAVLAGAHLAGSDLSSADGLTQAQLEEAEGDAETTLPKGLTQPARWNGALVRPTYHSAHSAGGDVISR